MIKIIRNHQKKFLAGVAIFSMISFVVTMGNKGQGASGASDHKIASINGGSLNFFEMSQAHAEYDNLKRYVNFSPREESPEAYEDAQAIREILQQKNELFMLLSHEANALGIPADEDEVQTTMRYRTSKELAPDTDTYDVTLEGVRDLFKILNRYKMLRNSIKVSQPQVDQFLAHAKESLNIKLVQLNAEDFLVRVPSPTTQQAQEQFTKFADTAPRHPLPTTNPFGFGYKQPLRVSFQYLRIANDTVTDAVVATKSAYDWNVLAKKYYYNHADEFQQPVQAPMGPTLPGLKMAATSPTGTKPFDIVKDQILTQLRQDQVNQLTDQVISFITATLNNDWQAYSKYLAANPTTAPSNPEPNSSLGVPYSSTYTYLLKLNDTVRDKFKVDTLPTKSPDFLNVDQYTTWPLVGSPATADFITQQASSYVALHDKNDPTASAVLMQPSGSLDGPGTGTHLFIRLAAALPAQPPADLSLVRAQVDLDWRMDQAYKIAQSQAAALLIAANAGNLDAAALATGHPVLPGDTTLSEQSPEIKAIVPPLGDSTYDFYKQAFMLLTVYQPATNAHPAQTIELPAQKRIFVAQLKSVIANWTDKTYFRACAQANYQTDQPLSTNLTYGWFNLKETEDRLGYKPVKGSE